MGSELLIRVESLLRRHFTGKNAPHGKMLPGKTFRRIGERYYTVVHKKRVTLFFE